MWYHWIGDEFPVRTMVLIAIAVGGLFLFNDVIRDKVDDVKEGIHVTGPASKPVVNVPKYVPGQSKIVYEVSREDSRLLLI